MKHFLAPNETRPAWYLYVLSIVFVLIGTVSFSTTIIGLAVYAKGEVTPETTQSELMARFTNNQQLVINMIPFVIGFLLLFYAARIIHRRKFLSFVTLRPRLDLKRIGVGALLWGAITTILFIVELAQGATGYQWNFETKEFLLLLLIAIVLTPIQTGFEEILVRGFTLQFFGRFIKLPIVAILMSTGFFALLHLGNPEVDALGYFALVYYLISGLITAIIAVMDDGIELSWGFHLANNLFSILIITSDESALRTDALFVDTKAASVGWEDLIVPILIFPLFVFILSRIYKWKNWKGKLLGTLVTQIEKEENEGEVID